jgi:hypothetical protein
MNPGKRIKEDIIPSVRFQVEDTIGQKNQFIMDDNIGWPVDNEVRWRIEDQMSWQMNMPGRWMFE